MPKSKKGHDAIWLIVDHITKSALFLPIKEACSLEQLAKLYTKEVISRHGLPLSIVSNWDTRFTSRFWKQFHGDLGTKLEIGKREIGSKELVKSMNGKTDMHFSIFG